jgi:phage-related protein
VIYSYSGLLSNQTVKEDADWSYQLAIWLPWNWEYSATLADGKPLPSWITFNAATRTFSGTPPQDFTGEIEIAVYAREWSRLVGSDTFKLTITPVNDAPTVKAAIPDQTTLEDAAWSFQVPAGTFTDVDSSNLTFTAALASGSPLPSWLTFNGASRTFVGKPPQDFNGSLELKVTANDGSLSAADTFRLTINAINDAPVLAAAITDQAMAEDTPWTFQVPAGAFTDVDSASLTYTATLDDGSALPSWLTFHSTTRTFTGTPPANVTGVYNVKVTASDGAATTSDTFRLTINPVNDAPIVAVPVADQTVAEDTPWSFQVPAGTFTDVDSSLTYRATLASGAALPNWLSFDAATGTFSGTLPQNFNGAIDLRVTANDGLLSVSDTFTLTVSPVNDAPVVATPLGPQHVVEDTPWTFQVPAGTFQDVDSSSLTYTVTLDNGQPLPSWLSFDPTTRTFSGTPPQDVNGSLGLTVRATDGSLSTSDTFTLTLVPSNDAPVVSQPIADATILEEADWTFQVPAETFADVDSSLYYTATLSDGTVLPSWLTFDASTRTFAGKPPPNFSGAVDLKVSASDGEFAISDTFTLNILAVDSPPVVGTPIAEQTVAEDTPWLFKVPANAFVDPDSSGLTYRASQADGSPLPRWLNFDEATETFRGTPPADFAGFIDLAVTAKDGTSEKPSTFRLVIEGVNDAPVASPILDQSVAEDTLWTFRLPAGTFSDIDSTSLTYTAFQSDGSSLPTWLRFDAETGTFSGTPPQDMTGELDLTVGASDGSLSASETFRLTITPINDAPVTGGAIADQSTLEDTPWTFQVPADAFTDADTDNLTYTATMWDGAALPGWLSFDPTTRTFSGTPPVDYTGSLRFKVTADDGSFSTSTTFTLAVSPVNDAPAIAMPIADQMAAEAVSWSFQVPDNTFFDIDGDSVTYRAALSDGSALPSWLAFDAATRTFSGTPPLNQPGTLDLTVTTSDGSLDVSDTFRLTIAPVNDAPVLTGLIADQTVSEEAAWAFKVPAGTFTDADSDLTYTATLADGSGLLSWLSFDAATQTFSGTPPQDYTGAVDLKIVASDGALTASDTFTLTVTPVNDAPAVAAAILDQAALPGLNWLFQVPVGAFFDVDRDGLTYSATLADGAALPSWVAFDTTTGTFSGVPPLAQSGSLDFTVTASDGSLTASDSFTLLIKSAVSGPVEGAYDDLIEAGDGNDWIHGGLGNDEMQGEGGNDTIYGGQDNGKILRDLTTGKLTELVIGDNLYGNDGQDTYYYAQGDGIDLIWDFRPGEDVIKISGFNPQDVKVTFVRGVTNRIATPGHDKLALFFGNDRGAIVFNDFPGPKAGDVILDFGTSQLTWLDLLSMADTQVGDTLVSAVSAGPGPNPTYTPTGTGAPVELSGGNGNDILTGGAGADRLYGNDGYNWFEGFAGDDQLFGGNAQDVMLGAEGRDRLYGNEGVNWLDGGADDDELYGGNVQDTLLGGSGNDVIYSNGGDDLLVGGAGADKLYGTGGTDIIYGDDADGSVLTLPAKPIIEPPPPPPPPPPPVPESVITSTSMTLAPLIKNVTATGKGAVTLVGNDLDNTITGNAGKNTLRAGAGNDEIDGGYGNDRLYGSTGKDAFVFTTKLGTATSDRKVNFDTIGDFSVKYDSLHLDNAIFKKLGKVGKLNKAYFTIGEKATDKNDYVIYNKKTGILSYDADGSGSGKAVEFAKVTKNLKLTSADFFTV